MLSMRVVRGLVEAVEQVGVARALLLRDVRIDASQLESDDAYVPRAEVYRLCSIAIDLTRDPAFGLHWAERLGEKTFNPISHLVAHSSTLRQALTSLFQFHRLVSHQPSFQISESDNKVTVRYFRLTGESEQVQRFTSEMLVTGVFRILRMFNPQARPECASFDYPAPSYRDEYARVFENTERFDQAFTGIVFAQSLMDAVSPHKDEDVHTALKQIAERRILRLTRREPFALRVRDVIVAKCAKQRVDMEVIARSLGLSMRSLRRRLVEEGTSYNEVANEALATVAKQLLRNKDLTIQEAAYEMGFAATSTFHRAFKRWTGMTPSSFRDKLAS